MPLYSWKCALCGAATDVVRPLAESAEPPRGDDGIGMEYCTVDEKHGAPPHKWERVIGLTNFRLAGRGWARDGYR